MALPKVTPGTYNYGQYASPTQVKYNAAGDIILGQAIGTSLKTIGELAGDTIKRNKADNEARLKQKEQDLILLSKLDAENAAEMKGYVESTSGGILYDGRASRREKRKNPENYYKMEAIHNENMAGFRGLNALDIDKDALNKINVSELVDGDDQKYQTALSLSQGKYRLKKGEDGLFKIHFINEETGEPQKEGINLNSFMEDIDDLTNFEYRFNYGQKDYVSDISNIAKGYGETAVPALMKEAGKNVSDGFVELDQDKGIERLVSGEQKELLTPLVARYGGKIVRDIISRDFPDLTPEEANMKVREILARQIVAKVPQFAKDPNKMTIDQQLRLRSIQLQERVFNKQVKSEKDALDYTEKVFGDVRKNITSYFDSSTGLGVGGYDVDTGILTYYKKDAQGNTITEKIDMVNQPGARKRVYKEIYKDFVAPGIEEEFRTQAIRKFNQLISKNPAYVRPSGRPQAEGVETLDIIPSLKNQRPFDPTEQIGGGVNFTDDELDTILKGVKNKEIVDKLNKMKLNIQ